MPDMLYEKFPEKHYALFTLNRPDRLNALGSQLSEDQDVALDDFNGDLEMRAGIVTGAGRAFSAGADLKEMSERNARNAEIEARTARGEISSEERGALLVGSNRRPARNSFSASPKPIIAAINGLCLAGGMERSMDCDIRIASTAAYFGLFEVKRGIIAGYGVQHLARLMPFGEALYLLTTGDTMTAQEAYRLGFLHEVVEPEALMPRAVEIAEMIAANAPLAVQGSKAIAHAWRMFGIDETRRVGEWVSRTVLSSADSKEGPRAFAEKRPAVWQAK